MSTATEIQKRMAKFRETMRDFDNQIELQEHLLEGWRRIGDEFGRLIRAAINEPGAPPPDTPGATAKDNGRD